MTGPVFGVRATASGDVVPGPQAVCDCPDREPVHVDGCRYAGHPNRLYDGPGRAE